MDDAAGDGVQTHGTYEQFLALHEPQLVNSGIPPHLWPRLYVKLSTQLFDAGNYFQILQIEDEEGDAEGSPKFARFQVTVIAENGVRNTDPDCVFLIDHAWTYRPESAHDQLMENESLLARMASMMQIPDWQKMPTEAVVGTVMKEMWKFNDHYIVGGSQLSVEDKVPIWYVMDEFGSRIQRSDEPNVRIVPFFFVWTGESFSVLFSVENIEPGETVFRGYLERSEPNELRRSALKLPWVDFDFSGATVEPVDPGDEYFRAMKVNETMPDTSVPVKPLHREKIPVYAEYTYVIKYLTDERFHVVAAKEEADILWLSTHFKEFEKFSRESPEKRINQFPYEGVITVKDLLSIVCARDMRESGQNALEWMPKTFNLQTELVQFVKEFQLREQQGLDNHWICKPWNLARSLDTYVTSNLSQIVRLVHTGPKIVQKYLHNPVLFERPEIGKVKFDVRYIILLKSVQPLEVYVYNRFWLRFANKPFSLDRLDDYEKHFTVMNYSATAVLKQMTCDDFIVEFERQNPMYPWKDVDKKIKKVLKRCFIAATAKPVPMGIGHCGQSRAVYAIDLMLNWDPTGNGDSVIEPKILEVNWGPDCQRACEYYPDFYNDLFQVLFLDELEGKPVTLL